MTCLVRRNHVQHSYRHLLLLSVVCTIWSLFIFAISSSFCIVCVSYVRYNVIVLERMDLRRVKNEDKLDLCRKYFYGS